MKKIPSVDQQYKNWLKDQDFSNKPEDGYVRDILVKELTFLSSMTVEEYTLYRKWQKFQYNFPKKETNEGFETFFGQKTDKHLDLKSVKDQIWVPDDPMDFMKLEPKLVYHDSTNVHVWKTYGTFISSGLNNSKVGRQLHYSIVDNVTNKLLGITCMSGDFMDLTARDQYIGWTNKQKTSGMLNHTAIGSTIIPTQPLGYSYVGGKLIALLILSNVLENKWNEKYGNKLVGVTTTSLFGSLSQYNNLSYWAKRGHTNGSIRYTPSKETIKLVREWLKHNHTRKYFEWYYGLNERGQGLKRDHKQRSLIFTYNKLGIPIEITLTNHQRGVYFCKLFENTCEYLRMEISEDKLLKRFDNSVEALSQLWKEKYAKKRVEALLKDGRYTKNILFYDNLIGITWEEAKERYLKDIGR